MRSSSRFQAILFKVLAAIALWKATVINYLNVLYVIHHVWLVPVVPVFQMGVDRVHLTGQILMNAGLPSEFLYLSLLMPDMHLLNILFP